jgi:hypothetical protein
MAGDIGSGGDCNAARRLVGGGRSASLNSRHSQLAFFYDIAFH